MNKWKVLTTYIDENQVFTGTELKTLGIDTKALDQYKHHLKRSGFIISTGINKYARIKTIGNISIYKVKMIGFDLELEEA